MKDSKKGSKINKCDHKGKGQSRKQREENSKIKSIPQSKKTLSLKTRIHVFSKYSKDYRAKKKRKEKTQRKSFSFSFKRFKEPKVPKGKINKYLKTKGIKKT